MKTLSEIRNSLNLQPREITYRVDFLKKSQVDFDVYLPSKDRDLQRDFVWSIEQKREIIMSLLLRKHIPHLAIINTIGTENGSTKDSEVCDIYQIIDGKQRLSSIFSFLDDEFTIILEGDEYKFSELPEDYQRGIKNSYLRAYEVLEEYDVPVSDEDKIQWFKFINFAGTPQEKAHMDSL